MKQICFDFDFIIFEAVSVAQRTFITVTHNPTGKVMEFENRTELWGDFRKKEGGWVGMRNKLSGNDYYKAEDFTVVDGAELRPFRVKGKDGAPDTFKSPSDGAKEIIDDKISMICAQLKCGNYFGYTGTGEVFRHSLATLLPYKGNREDLVTPILLKEMKQYVIDHHNAVMVTGIEADDACSMANVKAYKAWIAGGKKDADKLIGVAIDKDAKQTEGWHFNPGKDSAPRLIEGFGSLWLTDKGDVDGCGRMWLYYQVACGDSTDNYKSNCFSDKKYASKGAFKDIGDSKTDKEAFRALVEVFQKLYPQKKTVITFRGEIEIDALYVMQEMFNMAMMLRHEGDKIDVKAVLTKLGIQYE